MARRILLAEPDPNTASLVRRYLEAAGYEVIESQDVDAACQLIKSQAIDLALVEADLPGSGSLELLTYIRRQPRLPGLPVIVLGGQAGSDVSALWLEAGADGVISRPFSAAVLVAQVRAMLRRTRLKEIDP
jgi:DNA-binding response OmpR family regulator